VLAAPTRNGQLFHLDFAHYELIAFLFVPALILAVVALFWVPPRPDGQGPIPEGRRLRQLLILIFLGAFLLGFAH
jgi:hypothetical protein